MIGRKKKNHSKPPQPPPKPPKPPDPPKPPKPPDPDAHTPGGIQGQIEKIILMLQGVLPSILTRMDAKLDTIAQNDQEFMERLTRIEDKVNEILEVLEGEAHLRITFQRPVDKRTPGQVTSPSKPTP